MLSATLRMWFLAWLRYQNNPCAALGVHSQHLGALGEVMGLSQVPGTAEQELGTWSLQKSHGISYCGMGRTFHGPTTALGVHCQCWEPSG